ncbi:MAG: PHB depolymerase family esterase, partial [Bacteroidia bacterium]|nr:PHB depolymerase family esterase [Bacteroidia bacterium]
MGLDKKFPFLFFASFFLCLFLFPNGLIKEDSLIELKNFGPNPGNLKLFYFDPFEKADTLKHPLVVVLHGCSQGARAAAALTGWNKIAKEQGFYVLYPEQKFFNNPSSCFNWFLKGDIEKGRGECASIMQMISFVKTKNKIDSTKIFVTGLSAGAGMTVVMLSTYPNVFNAGAEFAGGPYKAADDVFTSPKAMLGNVHHTAEEWADLVKKQNPFYVGKYPRLIIYQGEKDPVVNHRNADEMVLQWCKVSGIDTIADTTVNGFQNVKDIDRISYCNSRIINGKKTGEEIVIYYKVKNLSHQLMIDPGPGKKQGGKDG